MTTLTATGTLTRLALRRDRVLLTLWLLGLGGMVAASSVATADLYTTVDERITAAAALNSSPAIVALYGPIVETSSLGEVAMTKMTVLYAVFVALMAMLVVRRQLRTEEESGRAELLGGTAVGRDAPLGAAVVESVTAAALLSVLAALGCLAGALPAQGSMLFAASWGGTVLVFAAVTMMACQVSASARTCGLLAAGAIATAFVLRAVGDTVWAALSWASPLGWNTQLHAWSAQPRWWVLGLYPLAGIAAFAGAVVLRTHRDLGGGLWSERPGPARGSPGLADSLALAWRTTRSTWWTWGVTMAVLGTLFGAMSPGIADLLTSASAREMVAQLGGEGALQDTMISAILGILAVVVTCYAVVVVGRGGRDEHEGLTEQVLATGASRSSAFAATAAVATVGATALLAVAGLAMALGYGGADRSTGRMWDVVAAGVVHAPAVWCVVALTLLAYAWRATWTWAGWVLVAAFLTLGQLGELFRLPGWMQDLSPYAHTPLLPAAELTWTPLLALTVVAAAVGTLGWRIYEHRDIG